MARVSANKAATTCVACFAWGVLPGRSCRAGVSLGQNHARGTCAGCQYDVPLKKDYCRLCWTQASVDAKDDVTVLLPYLVRVGDHQLFFASMRRALAPPLAARRQPDAPELIPAARCSRWVQLRLVEVPRDFTHFERGRDADLATPSLVEARHTARVIAEARGWPARVFGEVDRALVILLSHHRPGELVRHSELFPALRARGLSVGRTVEVLALMAQPLYSPERLGDHHGNRGDGGDGTPLTATGVNLFHHSGARVRAASRKVRAFRDRAKISRKGAVTRV